MLKTRIILFLIGIVCITVIRCGAPSWTQRLDETEVPFEDVAISEEGGAYEGFESKLLLATMPDELTRIKTLASSVPISAIEEIDLSKYALIALFRGRQGGTNYKVIIESIRRNEKNLII